ncbi:hypothetical protein AAVH_28838, partial [Aphelenchoides avenae]
QPNNQDFYCATLDISTGMWYSRLCNAKKPYVCKIPSVNGTATVSTPTAPTKGLPTSSGTAVTTSGMCPNGWEFLPISRKCVKVKKASVFLELIRCLKAIPQVDYWLNHLVNCTRLGGNLISITAESSNSEIA